MLVSLVPVSEAIVHVMQMNGYAVEVTQEAETYHAIATHPDGGTHSAEGPDLYLTICALAEKVGRVTKRRARGRKNRRVAHGLTR